jgi:hypothetical protein
VIKEMLVADRVGCFGAGNNSPSESAVAAICRELYLADPARRRLRCLGHIINLSAKDLLFGKEEGNFDFEVSEMAKLKMEGAPSSRIAGAKRPHNLILWVQKVSQRIQKFKDLTTEEPDAKNSRCSSP